MINRDIHFNVQNLIEIAVVALIGLALWNIRDFILVLAVALVISTFIEDFVKRGKKHKIPRALSVVLFYIVALTLFLGLLVFLVPVLVKEVGLLSQIYPEIQNFVNLELLQKTIGNAGNFREVLDQINQASIGSVLFKNLSVLFGNIFNVVFVFIISFYLSIQEGSFDKVLKIFTPLPYEEKVLDLWHRSQTKIGTWFRGQLLIALILTILTYAGLSLFGLPYAFLLSLLAGVFGLVPYGIFLAILPAMAIGASNGGIRTAFLVLVFYILLQQVLDYILQPIILKRLTGIPSLMVILSVIIGAKLFGFFGLILAVPTSLFVLEWIGDREQARMNERASRQEQTAHTD